MHVSNTLDTYIYDLDHRSWLFGVESVCITALILSITSPKKAAQAPIRGQRAGDHAGTRGFHALGIDSQLYKLCRPYVCKLLYEHKDEDFQNDACPHPSTIS
jgi:hypothetical protein